MRLRPVAGILLRQFYLFRSSPVRLFPTFAWVAIDIVVWGFLTRYLNAVTSHSAGATHVDFVPSLLGAVLFWDFFTRIMQGVTTAFFEDIWSRNFLNLFASPLSISEYVTGLVLTSIATSFIALVVMLVLATLVFGLSFFSLGLMLIPFVLVLFLFGVALGIFASAMVLRLGPASEWLVWPMPALLSPFVGVGLNFTRFFNVNERGPLTGTDLTLGNSWGFAAHGGLDWRINEQWLAGVDLRWIDIDTTARVNGVKVGTVNVDPLVYGAYVGYRF